MTRNFEEEYKKYADSTVPDLWGRIEAAIDEKEAGSKASHKNNAVVFFKRYSGLAIACACVLVTIGALKLIADSSKSGSAEMAASAPMDAAHAAAEYAAEPMAEAASEEAPAVAEAASEEAPAVAEAAPAEAATETAEPMAESEELVIDENEDRSYKTATAGASLSLICKVDDLSRLDDEHKITATVVSTLGSGIDEGTKIVLNIGEDNLDRFKEVFTDSKDSRYVVVIEPGDAGEYTVLDAREK